MTRMAWRPKPVSVNIVDVNIVDVNVGLLGVKWAFHFSSKNGRRPASRGKPPTEAQWQFFGIPATVCIR